MQCRLYVVCNAANASVLWQSRLRSADHGDVVVPRVLSRFGCRSFRVSGPTIWNDLPVDFRSSDITREQFKRSLKSWLFECAYGRRRVWETVQSEGASKKWTYLLTKRLILGSCGFYWQVDQGFIWLSVKLDDEIRIKSVKWESQSRAVRFSNDSDYMSTTVRDRA